MPSVNYSSLRLLIIVAGFGVLSLPGCKSVDIPTGDEKGQSTPSELIAKWHKAAINGDLSAYTECFSADSQKQLELIKIHYSTIQDLYEFEAALKKAYGDDALEKYRKIEINGANCNFLAPPKDDPEWSQQTKIEMTGEDRAVASLLLDPDSETPSAMPLYRTKGVWVIDTKEAFKDCDACIDLYKQMAEMIARARKRVGKPGVTLEDVKKAMLNK